MLLSLEQLLRDREPPLCVRQDTKVSDALAQMITYDYSQLPIVDSQGRLTGMVSEQSIARRYYHLSAAVSLLDLQVSHCQTKAKTLPFDGDITEALRLLNETAAIVVVKEEKPYRILTHYDTTVFFLWRFRKCAYH